MSDLLEKARYIFTKNQKIKLLILFFLMVGGALFETLGISLIIPFISVVAAPDSIIKQPILAYFYNLLNLKTSNEFLILLALLLVFLYAFKSAYMFMMYKLQYRFVYNNQMRLSAKLMDCYLKKSYEYHINKNTAEIVRSVTSDVARLFGLVSNALLLLTEVLIVICLGTFLAVVEPFMTLATLALLGVALLVFIVMYRKILTEAGEKNQASYGMMIKWINQGLGGIKEIKVMRREHFFIDAYSNAANKYAETQRKSSFLTQAPKLFIEPVCICGMLIIISIMLYSGRDISAMLPQLAAFAVAAFRIMPSFNRITVYYNGVVFHVAAIDLVYRDLRDNEKISRPNADDGEDIRLLPDDTISIEHLTYQYPNSMTDVIKDACFGIPINKSIAIIGPSGAGKTTFADILLGLLPPTAGSITVDGKNIHKNTSQWSKKIGYIPQGIYLCDDTVKNNVAFGLPECEIDEDKVWQVLEKAQVKDFVDSLPETINTMIGERGIRLSGGQRQRIGIARAFYNDPDILVLDEATSSLDDDTEAAVMDAIDVLRNEKTLIIIAHRMSTIKNCDMVFKIENNNVVPVEIDKFRVTSEINKEI